MGRPRKEEGTKAIDLLERAFFRQLATSPFEKLTISGIAKVAGVNRNSFYYHYTDMNDLAVSAVSNLLLPDIPRLVAAGLGPGSKELNSLLTGAVRHGNYRKLLTIIGPNSTAELRGILKQSVSELWLGAFGLTPEDLNEEESATISFVMAGAFDLASAAAPLMEGGDAEAEAGLRTITATAELPIMRISSQLMTQALTDAAQRKRALGT